MRFFSSFPADGYTSFAILSEYQKTLFSVFGLITFLVNIKTLNVFSLNNHVKHFTRTLRRSSWKLVNYAIIFGVLFMAFGGWGVTVFGTHVTEFRTLFLSMQTQFSMLLGKFNIAEMEEVNG